LQDLSNLCFEIRDTFASMVARSSLSIALVCSLTPWRQRGDGGTISQAQVLVILIW
jgi:hypothetical protein